MGKNKKKEQRLKRRAKSQNRLRHIQPADRVTLHLEEDDWVYDVETGGILTVLGSFGDDLVLYGANRIHAFSMSEFMMLWFSKKWIPLRFMDDDQIDEVCGSATDLSVEIVTQWEWNPFLVARSNHLKRKPCPHFKTVGKELTTPLDEQLFWITNLWEDEEGQEWAEVWDSVCDESFPIHARKLGFIFQPAQPQGENHYEDNQTAH